MSLPFKGQAGIVHEAVGCQFDGLAAVDDGRDDIRCEEGEAQQPGDIGGDDILGICDLLQGQPGVLVQLLADGERPDQKPDQAMVGAGIISRALKRPSGFRSRRV